MNKKTFKINLINIILSIVVSLLGYFASNIFYGIITLLVLNLFAWFDYYIKKTLVIMLKRPKKDAYLKFLVHH